jgi:hypothetical protein
MHVLCIVFCSIIIYWTSTVAITAAAVGWLRIQRRLPGRTLYVFGEKENRFTRDIIQFNSPQKRFNNIHATHTKEDHRSEPDVSLTIEIYYYSCTESLFAAAPKNVFSSSL